MVNYLEPLHLNATFNALSDPTRREIVKRVSEKDSTIKEIAKPFSMSLPAVSKHIKVLENAQIITRKKQGRSNYLAINPTPLKEASRFLSFYQTFWNEKLDSLESYLSKRQIEMNKSRKGGE